MLPSSYAACTADQLRALARAPFPPTIIDVRRRTAFERDPVRLPMALRREPEAVEQWAVELEPWRPVVVYCVHGHEVSQNAATALRARGHDATYLDGGLERWRESGGPVEPWAPPTRWVTRARPKIDRHAPEDQALRSLADIVRAADTDTLGRSQPAAGLLAVSLGLGRGLADDAALMKHGMLVYDALYAWCRERRGERPGCDPVALRS